MNAEPQLTTVFRSADDSAEEDANAICEVLEAEGLSPVVLDDSAPGVPVGAYEVRVPEAEAARAEQLIAQTDLPDSELDSADESPALEAETVFSAQAGATAEMQATAVKNLLEAKGIAAIMIGDAVLPNLGFEVRVAREYADEARQVIAQAEAIGAAAAEEEERATEAEGPIEPVV